MQNSGNRFASAAYRMKIPTPPPRQCSLTNHFADIIPVTTRPWHANLCGMFIIAPTIRDPSGRDASRSTHPSGTPSTFAGLSHISHRIRRVSAE